MSNENKTQSSKKYVVLALVAILAVIGIVMSNNPEEESPVVSSKPEVTANVTEENPVEEPVTARIDIYTKLVNTDNLLFEVYVNDAKTPEKQAKGMKKHGTQGYVIQRNDNNVNIAIKALHDAEIKIAFKGPWDKDKNGNMIEHWVDYNSIIINGKEILSQSVATWHNKSFKYTINARAGEDTNIDVQWGKHIGK